MISVIHIWVSVMIIYISSIFQHPGNREIWYSNVLAILRPPSTDCKLWLVSHFFSHHDAITMCHLCNITVDWISISLFFVYLVLAVTSSNQQVRCEVTNQTCASFCLKIALRGVANGQGKHPVKLLMDTPDWPDTCRTLTLKYQMDVDSKGHSPVVGVP